MPSPHPHANGHASRSMGNRQLSLNTSLHVPSPVSGRDNREHGLWLPTGFQEFLLMVMVGNLLE